MRFADGIEQYVCRKHAERIEFIKGEECLKRLNQYVGDLQLHQVKTQHVVAFLNGSPAAAVTWRLKYFILQHFFDYWAAREAMPEMLMPPIRPKERQTFLPHVYSRAQLKLLLKATVPLQQSKLRIARPTLRALITLLYGTGARIGEVLSLSIEDVNLKCSSITITNKNPNRCRQIPIGADLRQILEKYLAWRIKRESLSRQLFITELDKSLTYHLANKTFRRLRQIANVARDKRATYQPRLQDLQCTFAVHRITTWIRNGDDLNRLLPALAVYMGFVGLTSTERYLHLTPERFRKDLNKLSPGQGKRHWRDNKSLMEFLGQL